MSAINNIVGIDIGNDKCVVAIVKPKAIQILMNHDAKYEIPSVVSFTKKKRQIGTEKSSLAMMNPQSTITQIKRLIGQNFDEPGMAEELKLLPFKTSKAEDGGIAIHMDYLGEEQTFTPVQILAMLLYHLKQMIEHNDADLPASDYVISVPSYFNDLQRVAYLNAAEIAGLNPLRLMNDGTAIALGYGYFKRELDSPVNVVFVDVGHSDTQVTVAQFDREGVTILAHAFDRNLGGRDFDGVLYSHFLKGFNTKYGINIESNPRATIRLMSACEKAKTVLTANREANISIDCLVNDIGVDGSIERDSFDELSTQLLNRLRTTLANALKNAKLENAQINSVELAGSGSRIPAISNGVRDIFRMEPSRTLNGSDCVARGCALQCSMLSGSRRSKDYKVQDSIPFSVGFTWRLRSDETSEDDENQNVNISKTGSSTHQSVSSKSSTKETELSIKDEDANSVSKPSDSDQMSCILLDKGQHISSRIMKVIPEASKQFQFSIFYVYDVDSKPSASQKSRTFKVDDIKMGSKIPVRVEISIDLHGMVVIAAARPNHVGKAKGKQEITWEKLKCNEILPIGMSNDSLTDAKERERCLLGNDEKVDEVQRQKNDLEAFVYSTRKELNGYEEYAKKSEKERILKKLDALELWFCENEDHEDESVIYSKELHALKELVNPIECRYKYFMDCMEATKELDVSIAELDRVLKSKKVAGNYYHYSYWIWAVTQLQKSFPKDTEQVPSLLEKIKKITRLLTKEIFDHTDSRKTEDSHQKMVKYASEFREINRLGLFEYYKCKWEKKERPFIHDICTKLSELLKTIAPNSFAEDDELYHETTESPLKEKDQDNLVDKHTSDIMQSEGTADPSCKDAAVSPSRMQNSKRVELKNPSSSKYEKEHKDIETERIAEENEYIIIINSIISAIQLQLSERNGDFINQQENDEIEKKLDDIKNRLLKFGDDKLYDIVKRIFFELQKHLASFEEQYFMKEEATSQRKARLLYMIFDSRVNILCIEISLSDMTRRQKFNNLWQNVTNICNNLEKQFEEIKSQDTLPCETEDTENLKRLQQEIQHFANSVMEETKSEASVYLEESLSDAEENDLGLQQQIHPFADTITVETENEVAVLGERIPDIEKKVFGRYRYVAGTDEKKYISKLIKKMRGLLERGKTGDATRIWLMQKRTLENVITNLEIRYEEHKCSFNQAAEDLCDCIFDHLRAAKSELISASNATLIKKRCDDYEKWLEKNFSYPISTGDIKRRKEELNTYCEAIKRNDSYNTSRRRRNVRDLFNIVIRNRQLED